MLDRARLNMPSRAAAQHAAKILLVALLLAVVLEACTIFGAPAASVIDLGSWSKKRIVIIWILLIALYAASRYFGTYHAFVQWARFLYLNRAAILPRCLFYVGGFIGSGLLGVLATVLLSFTGAYRLTTALELFFFAICGCLFIAFANRKFMAKQPEKVFVPIGITLGVLICLLLPIQSNVSWDDHVHFDRANAVSYLIAPEYSQADAEYLDYPYIEPGDFDYWSFSEGEYETILHEFDEGTFENVTTAPDFVSSRGTSIINYESLGYVPSALGLWIGRLLHLPFTWTFLLGRISNILFLFTLVYFGVKNLKSQKVLAMSFALLPTIVFIGANYSYDTWLTGWVLFAFLRYLSWLQSPGEPVTFKEVVLVILSLLIGLGPKAIYFPIFILLLFIPGSKFKTKKFALKYRIAMIGSAAIVLATFLLPFVVQGPGSGDARGGAGVDSTGQVAFVLSDPVGYSNILAGFLANYLSIPNSANYTSFFAYLGMSSWGSLPIIILAIIAVTDSNECNFSYAKWRYRVAALLLLVGTSALMASALYVSYTAVGSSTIEGCQGRYLIPLVLPFLALFFNSKMRNDNPRAGYNYTVLAVSFLVLASTTFELCMPVYSA